MSFVRLLEKHFFHPGEFVIAVIPNHFLWKQFYDKQFILA